MQQLEPNTIKEMHCACPYYMGEEMTISAPNPQSTQSLRFKKFNPIIDMVDERIQESLKEKHGAKGA